jgi:hypothetical protein
MDWADKLQKHDEEWPRQDHIVDVNKMAGVNNEN